ncbi:hypothetical protein [Rubrivirga sp.]|uniref:hypothetical protein n=1 Tax=Rubrivirga sp. TaxID=1885344 RepID=UPI003C75553D
MSEPGSPLSRRESLKRAAGALALGLGAPAALAAGDEVSFVYPKLEFYDRSGDRPVASVRISEEVFEELSKPGAFTSMKLGPPYAVFEVRRSDR